MTFDGCYFSLESLHAHHPRCEYLVIDNAPKGCNRTRDVTMAVGGRYLHRPDLRGTSAPRDALFRLAKTDWVMCVDSHVLLEPGAVLQLLEWIEKNPESKDLVAGPLVYDDGINLATHWRPDAPPGLWGVWDCAWQTVDGETFAIGGEPRGTDPPLRTLDGEFFRVQGLQNRPETDLATQLSEAGCIKGGWKPFEVPMHGLGLFAMRKSAWLEMGGFNRLFRGFGGEEGYIHEKVRQYGGKSLCLPGVRWRHRFRHLEHGAPPPPYPLSLEDHVWNLLVGHRELGIDASDALYEHFGRRLPPGVYEKLVDQAVEAQPWKAKAPGQRLKILGVWYSNNSAPPLMLERSLSSIERAMAETMHHDVQVTTSSWQPIFKNKFPCHIGRPNAQGHAAIIEQMRRCLGLAGEYDAVCFLEHDVLYPPNYFDLMGNAFSTYRGLAPVVSNLDYEGLNATGWLAVKERHEPMHQLAMRRDVATLNLERAAQEAGANEQTLLEPQGARHDWVRLPPLGLAPSIHVNVPGRFTSHGEVCYEAKGKDAHPFWGDFKNWWPLEAEMSCGSCNQPAHIWPTLEAWYDAAKAQPSDFHEHMDYLRELASKAKSVVELSSWNKPASIAMLSGKPETFTSVCVGKPEWPNLEQLKLPTALSFVRQDSLAAEPKECDLLFIDTFHHADRLYAELDRWAPLCQHWVVVHCTSTYGEVGDNNSPGVLPALRRYMREHPEWSVIDHKTNNHGLTTLSREPADKPELPSTAKQTFNFAKAMTKYVAAGLTLADETTIEARLDECAMCPHRNAERCSLCGCPLLEGKVPGVPGKAFIKTEECPIGRWKS